MTLLEAISLLIEPPTSLVYHLTLAMALAVIFSLAQVHRKRRISPCAIRWSLTSGGLLVLRLSTMILAGLAWLRIIDDSILPLIDRFASLAGLIVFIAAILFAQSKRTSDYVLAIGTGICALLLILTPVIASYQEPSPFFNHTWPDAVWGFAGLLIGIAITTSLVLFHPIQWEYTFAPFALLTLGYGMHLSMGPVDESLAGFVRLAELISYPLFSIAASRSLAYEFTRSEPILSGGIVPNIQTSQWPAILKALAQLSTIADSSSMLELAAPAIEIIGKALNATISLIITPPDSSEKLIVLAGYNLAHNQNIATVAFSRQDCPRIATAIIENRAAIFSLDNQSPGTKTLKTITGFDINGPAMLTPLSTNDQVIGGIFLLSPYKKTAWELQDQEILKAFTYYLTQCFHLSAAGQQRVRTSGQIDVIIQPMSEQQHDLDDNIAQLRESLNEPQAQNQKHLLQYQTLLEQYETAQAELAKRRNTGNQLLEALEVAQTQNKQKLHVQLQRYHACQIKIADLESRLHSLQLGSGIDVIDSGKKVEQLASELKLTLQELAETRSTLAMVEASQLGMASSPARAVFDTIAINAIIQDLHRAMSSIQGYAGLLMGESVGRLGTMQSKFLERIHHTIYRMRTSLDDFASHGEPEIASLATASNEVILIEAINEAISRVSKFLREKILLLKLDLPDTMPPMQGNPSTIIQILVHLLQNAIAVSPKNEEITIAVRLQPGESTDFVLLSVSDRGEGISPDNMCLVFHPSFQLNQQRSRGAGDCTNELSIVKTLAETMGGRVWVDSKIGLGSTFSVLLPVRNHTYSDI
jgi:signal transduction histidine kinase